MKAGCAGGPNWVLPKETKILDLRARNNGYNCRPIGADVSGVDIAENLVAAGNSQRAKAAGLTNCSFQQGELLILHMLQDHSFDLVVSILEPCSPLKPLMWHGRWALPVSPAALHDGKLDTWRSYTGGTDPEDQFLLYTPTT